MGISDKVIQKTTESYQQSFIGETETVQYAVGGFGRHPVLLAGGLLGALFGQPRTLVVTDKAVHLTKQKKADALTPEDVIGTYPRQLNVESSMVTFTKIELGSEKIYISKVLTKGLKDLFPES